MAEDGARTVTSPRALASPRALGVSRIRERIATMTVGQRLPGERMLADELGIARMTVRSAIDTLIADGLLERRHGSGTYVTTRPLVRALGLTSFSQDMRSRGLVPGSRLIAFETIRADAALAQQLRGPVGEPVLRFTRLRLGSGEPMAVETTWLPARIAPGLRELDLDGSLYQVLESRYRIVPGMASVSIEPVIATPDVRDLLGLVGDQACLRIRMVDADQRGRVVMIANCVYRGDKYHLRADISGAAFVSRATDESATRADRVS